MTATQPILVTGATGLVGRRLVGSLRAASRAVRVVSRRREPPGFGAGVEIATWNGRDLPRAALAGAGAVVHLAGEPVFGGVPTRAHLERIRASRVDSTEAIVASLAALPQEERPECFVCASAVGYYGSRGDAELDESAPAGDTYLAEVCVAWERAARGAEPLGVRTVMLRTGIVLAREGGALPLMAMPFRFGLGGRLGDGRQWFPWIHVEDEVALVSAVLSDPGWSGPVNAVAPSPVTNAELTRALGELLNRPTLLPVPAFAVRLALGDLAGELLGSRRAVPSAALARGFRFAYPELAPALREALG